MPRARDKKQAQGNCPSCGTALDATGFCWKCAGEGPPPVEAKPPKPPPEPTCTHEENMRGIAAMRAVIYGKPGPLAQEIAKVVARLKVSTEKVGEEEAF